MDLFLFWVFAVAAVGGGLLTILRRNPIHSAIALVVTFLALAGLYGLLAAPFVAIMQVLVYAGAIMVLILFVIMLLNVPDEVLAVERTSLPRYILGAIVGIPLLVILVSTFTSLDLKWGDALDVKFGTVERVGSIMFQRYVYPFEILSLLLLVAIVGAVVLARRRPD